MAYMSQEHKKEIAQILKTVMPKNWKYSLRVVNHMKLCLTIKSADVDLIKECKNKYRDDLTNFSLNTYHLDKAYDGELLEIMEKITNAMNHKNYDNSDSQSDYFDVGHYIDIQIGRWDKPFVVH